MYLKSLLVAGLAAQAAAAPSISLATALEERGTDALEKRNNVCPTGSYLLYTDGTKTVCVGPLGVAAGVAVFALAFVPTVVLAAKGKGCAPVAGTTDPSGKTIPNKALSEDDKVLTVTQKEISAIGKRDAIPDAELNLTALDERDATPDAELSGDGYISLAPRAETLASRSTATSVYYSWQASGGKHCGTQLSTSDFIKLINNHIGKMMVATGATCGQFTINNSNAFSLSLKIAFCDDQYCYYGCFSR